MKQRYLTIILIFLGIFNVSMHSGGIYGILSNEDYRVLSQNNKKGPALRSALGVSTYWESYNEWLCFPAAGIDLRLSEHELEQPIFVPTLAVWQKDHLYEFEVSSDLIEGNIGIDIVNQWEALIEGEIAFCIEAAFLQTLEPDRSLWILKSLKTRQGYWNESEFE